MRLIRLPRRRHRSEADAGLTIVELIVSMLMLTIILAAVSTAFIVVTRTMRTSQVRLNQYNDGRVALESITRTLRAAVLPTQDVGSGSTCSGSLGGGTCLSAFIQGTASSLSFFSNIDNPAEGAASGSNNLGPRKVSYELVTKTTPAGDEVDLQQQVQVPDLHAWDDYNWQYSDCSTVPQDCQTTILAQNVVQVGGAAIFTYYANGVQLTGSTFDASDLAQVDSVDVAFSVEDHGTGVNPVPTTYLQRVALPNVDTYISETAS